MIDPADEGGEAPCFAHLGLDGACDPVEDIEEIDEDDEPAAGAPSSAGTTSPT